MSGLAAVLLIVAVLGVLGFVDPQGKVGRLWWPTYFTVLMLFFIGCIVEVNS